MSTGKTKTGGWENQPLLHELVAERDPKDYDRCVWFRRDWMVSRDERPEISDLATRVLRNEVERDRAAQSARHLPKKKGPTRAVDVNKRERRA